MFEAFLKQATRLQQNTAVKRLALGGAVIVVALVLAGTPWITKPAGAATLTVNSTGDAADASPGNGLCATAGGVCTLRAAIQEANSLAGSDTINFGLGSGIPSIAVASGLPTITGPLVISGNTGGASFIEINGAGAGTTDGFTVTAGNTTLQYLVINSFIGDGITFQGPSGGNLVYFSGIGMDTDGTTIAANTGSGVVVADSPNNEINNNLISGNGSMGIHIFGAGSIGNEIYANEIGLDTAGMVDRGNRVDGVRTSPGVSGSPSGTIIGGNGFAFRNVIAGNDGHGINLTGNGHTIKGNFIGTDITGTVMIPNGNGGGNDYGILVADDTNVIGGSLIDEPNTIAGASAAGIRLGPNAQNNSIWRNFLGVNSAGTIAMPNSQGISIAGSNNTLGSGAGNAGPVVAGNLGAGILVSGNNNAIYGSQIGIAFGTAMPNGSPLPAFGQSGIYVSGGTGTLIGGQAPQSIGAWNTIRHNRGGGILVGSAATGVNIRHNIISDNLGMEIDLLGTSPIFGLGPTPNDVGDTDAGANGRQNYPLISSAIATTPPNGVVVNGTLNSLPATSFTVRAYASDTCDGTLHGGGHDFNLLASVTTDGSGNASFSTPSFGSSTVVGDFVSMTATNNATGETSEFSPCAVVTAGCPTDVDCDGYMDSAPAGHIGFNTNTATDNCMVLANGGADQPNIDGNFIDHSPPYAPAVDDRTRANSDGLGDACDSDRDNDGVIDAYETESIWCAFGSATTDPRKADTDGDRFLDGAECTLGADPASSASKPLVTACGGTTDADGDKLTERVEVCFYGTDPNNSDTDGDKALDGGKDGCEAVSLNGDRIVNVADMGMLATAISNVVFRVVSVDVNKDGVWNPADQGLVASFISPSGQCPG